MKFINRTAMLVGCLLVGSLGVAQAAPSDEVRSIVVQYGDLDLSTAVGARALYSRISAAARLACPYPDTKELALYVKNTACREAAIEHAVNAVNSPQLAALQAEHAKRG